MEGQNSYHGGFDQSKEGTMAITLSDRLSISVIETALPAIPGQSRLKVTNDTIFLTMDLTLDLLMLWA